MDRAKVNELLKMYRQNKTRLASIRVEIQLANLRIEHLRQNAIYDLLPKGNPIDGMPHGTGRRSPVESAALKLASGYLPEEAQELQHSIEKLQYESSSLEIYVLYVEAWLTALTERERFIIERHILDDAPWRLLCFEYGKRFDIEPSKDTLRRMQVKALEKIYAAAK